MNPRDLKAFVVALSAFGLALLVACSPNALPVVPESNDESEHSALELLVSHPEQIGYAEVNEWVFQSSCNSCHNSTMQAGGIDLSQYAEVTDSPAPNLLMRGEPEESRLYTSLLAEAGARQMPPRNHAALTGQQKELVRLWIERGAPEVAGEPQAFVSLEERLRPYFQQPETIDYDVVREWVFEPGRCYDCHSEQGYRADETAILFGVNMTRYQDMFVLNGLVPGQPSHIINPATAERLYLGSSIFQSIAVERTMPPAEQGFQPLSALRVRLLRLWILNCAIEEYTPGEEGRDFALQGEGGKVRRCY